MGDTTSVVALTSVVSHVLHRFSGELM